MHQGTPEYRAILEGKDRAEIHRYKAFEMSSEETAMMRSGGGDSYGKYVWDKTLYGDIMRFKLDIQWIEDTRNPIQGVEDAVWKGIGIMAVV